MRRKVFKNLGWKIAGLILAFALWFHITTQRQYQRDFTLDIRYLNVPQSLVLTEDSQKTAVVRIRGEGKDLIRAIYFDHLELRVDLSRFVLPGDYTVGLTSDNLSLPSGMTDIQIEFVPSHQTEFQLIERSLP